MKVPRPAQRLDLSHVSRVLGSHARRFYEEELPEPLREPAFARFERKAYSRAELTWGLHAWRQRALDEYRSLVGLAEFLDELSELGLSYDTLSVAVRVVRDEARHVELCRRMVRALGGSDVIEGRPGYVRSRAKAPLLERVLTTVAGSLCIGETLSVALLAATRDVTPDPLARAVLTCLTADESVHSQLGWTLLPLLWPAAPLALRHKLMAAVEPSLTYAAGVALEDEGAAGPAARNPFGDLHPHERRAVFERTARRQVRLKFEALLWGSRRSRPGRSTSGRSTKAAAG